MTARKKVEVIEKATPLVAYLMLLSCSKCTTCIQGRFTEDPESWPTHRCVATRRPAPFTRFEDAPKRGSLHKYAID